jgi:hypothetical protein
MRSALLFDWNYKGKDPVINVHDTGGIKELRRFVIHDEGTVDYRLTDDDLVSVYDAGGVKQVLRLNMTLSYSNQYYDNSDLPGTYIGLPPTLEMIRAVNFMGVHNVVSIYTLGLRAPATVLGFIGNAGLTIDDTMKTDGDHAGFTCDSQQVLGVKDISTLSGDEKNRFITRFFDHYDTLWMLREISRSVLDNEYRIRYISYITGNNDTDTCEWDKLNSLSGMPLYKNPEIFGVFTWLTMGPKNQTFIGRRSRTINDVPESNEYYHHPQRMPGERYDRNIMNMIHDTNADNELLMMIIRQMVEGTMDYYKPARKRSDRYRFIRKGFLRNDCFSKELLQSLTGIPLSIILENARLGDYAVEPLP